MGFEPWWLTVEFRCKECGTRVTRGLDVDETVRLVDITELEPVKCNDCHLNYTL
jgi:DNA-directed RNA polymerase subunit RPC12/RpoP